jgi:hypothetical protein
MNFPIILVPKFSTSTKSDSNIVVKLGTIIMNLPTVAPKVHIFVMNCFSLLLSCLHQKPSYQ